MKKFIPIFLLVPSVCFAQAGYSNIGGINAVTSGGGGGSGEPGGVTNSIQYKVDDDTFGGSNWLTNGNLIELRPSDYLSENGAFRINTGSAGHDPGERRDDITSLGWNQNNAAAGKGGVTLTFEAYCGPTVGCPLPGQTETYFSTSDGMGHDGRPIGIFQAFDGTGYTYGINRFDSIQFWDRDQSYSIISFADDDGVGAITLAEQSVISSPKTSGNVFTISGQQALGIESNVLQIGKGSSNIDLSPGGDGSGIVGMRSNHFQLASSHIENSSGVSTIEFNSDGPHVAFNGINGDAEETIAPVSGSLTNLNLHLFNKGNGSIRLDTGSTGSIFLDTQHLKTGTFPGTDGVTASGTSCTITAITNGIITGASCTP